MGCCCRDPADLVGDGVDEVGRDQGLLGEGAPRAPDGTDHPIADGQVAAGAALDHSARHPHTGYEGDVDLDLVLALALEDVGEVDVGPLDLDPGQPVSRGRRLEIDQLQLGPGVAQAG